MQKRMHSRGEEGRTDTMACAHGVGWDTAQGGACLLCIPLACAQWGHQGEGHAGGWGRGGGDGGGQGGAGE
jgi:hypothetical protein